jgi:hypothetical protein
MYSLVAVMKKKVDRLTTACTTVTDKLVKEATNEILQKWTTWSERYTGTKKKGLDERASDPETYRLLNEDVILERNVLLSKKYQERLERDRDMKAKERDDESEVDDIEAIGIDVTRPQAAAASKPSAPKRSRAAAASKPSAPKRSRAAAASKPSAPKRSRAAAPLKSLAPLSEPAAVKSRPKGRGLVVHDKNDDES